MSDAPTPFDARRIFVALARHAVDYVTVGGIAVQAHGAHRVTQDLDIVVSTARENLGRLAAALGDLDARIAGPDGQRSASPPSAGMLAAGDRWHLTGPAGDVDVMTLPAHLGSYTTLRERALEVPLGEVFVPIAARDDLVAMKRAAGRPQDLADVELLEAIEDDHS